MSLSYRWHDSINDFTEEEWTACFGEGETLRGYALQRAVEASNVVEQCHYLRIERDGELVGIVSCFSLLYSLTDIASHGLQHAVRRIRKLYKHFLVTRIFIVGTPIATCDHMLGIPAFLKGDPCDDIQALVVEAISARAAECKAALTCMKEFNRVEDERFSPLVKAHFLKCRSPDSTYLYTGKVDGDSYLENMKSRYRKLRRNRLKDSEKIGLVWKRVEDFSPYIDRMHELYLNVLGRSYSRLEELTPQFFHAVIKNMPQQAYAMICFDGDKVVSFVLFLEGRHLHPLYIGMDYAYRDAGSLYFNALYKVEEEAETKGYDYTELGQTAYDAKRSLGVVAAQRYFYVHARRAWLNALLRIGGKSLFPSPDVPPMRNIFKKQAEYLQALTDAGVVHED